MLRHHRMVGLISAKLLKRILESLCSPRLYFIIRYYTVLVLQGQDPLSVDGLFQCALGDHCSLQNHSREAGDDNRSSKAVGNSSSSNSVSRLQISSSPDTLMARHHEESSCCQCKIINVALMLLQAAEQVWSLSSLSSWCREKIHSEVQNAKLSETATSTSLPKSQGDTASTSSKKDHPGGPLNT